MGVDVRLLVPGSSNWPLVGALSKAAYRPLLQAGVRVFEWNGPMLHAKTAVADGCWTRIGSSNSNLASWVSNRELDVTIMDRGARPDRWRKSIWRICRAARKSCCPRAGDAERNRLRFPRSPRPSRVKTKSERLLSGVIGLGSTLVALLSQRRNVRAGGGAAYLHRRCGAGLSRRCSLFSCRA